MISQFEIPPFLLPIYQACGTQYGIPWQVLASINKIETAFGTNLNVSTAGAVGWMQFMPSTWQAYGVDANGDGRKDPYNPVDAICAAARYLKAAGGDNDLRQRDLRLQPRRLVRRRGAALRAPVRQAPRRPGRLAHRPHRGRPLPGRRPSPATPTTSPSARPPSAPSPARVTGNAADVDPSSPTRQGINIYSHEGAPVVAVNDGTITKIGQNKRLGNYIVLAGRLRQPLHLRAARARLQGLPGAEAAQALGLRLQARHPGQRQGAAEARARRPPAGKPVAAPTRQKARTPRRRSPPQSPAAPEPPSRPGQRPRTPPAALRPAGAPAQRRQRGPPGSSTAALDKALALLTAARQSYCSDVLGYSTFKSYSGHARLRRGTMQLKPLQKGSQVVAGTVLGRVGKTDGLAPHLNFAIRPAGKGAPKIDPKPILDGWKLLEARRSTAPPGKNPFTDGADATSPRTSSLRKAQLQRKVLADPRLSIYACGRNDIRTGQIDRADPRGDGVPGRQRLPPDDHLAQVRPQLDDHLGQRLRALRPATRWTSRPSTAFPSRDHQGPGTLTDSLIKTC